MATEVEPSSEVNGKMENSVEMRNSGSTENQDNSLDKIKDSVDGENRLGNLRSKFEKQDSETTPGGNKRPTRVLYAGLQTAKTKFMEDAAKKAAGPPKGESRPKEITPPREGVNPEVSESQPRDPDPNVVRYGEQEEEDFSQVAETKKNRLAKFREMEQGGSLNREINEDWDKRSASFDSQEIVSSGATKNTLAKWRDIESGKEEIGNIDRAARQPIIFTREESNGGVFENQPQTLEGVTRCDQNSNDEILSISTGKMREEFLKSVAEKEGRQVNKLNPMEEIQQLAKVERTIVYENQPAERSQGIVTGDEPVGSEEIRLTATAKDLREKFVNFNSSNNEPKSKTPIQIRAEEGGVYENEPVILDGVVRHGEGVDPQASTSAKWATEAKQRFIEEASKSSAVKDKQPVKLDLGEGGIYENQPVRLENVVREEESEISLPRDTVRTGVLKMRELQEQGSRVQRSAAPHVFDGDSGNAGIFENTPEASTADARTSLILDETSNLRGQMLNQGRYASQAKRQFIERQRQEEQAILNKERPGIINIWNDLCEHSGVFENTPTMRSKDVARAYDWDDEEESGDPTMLTNGAA